MDAGSYDYEILDAFFYFHAVADLFFFLFPSPPSFRCTLFRYPFARKSVSSDGLLLPPSLSSRTFLESFRW